MDMGQNIFLVILWSQSNALVNKSLSFYKYIILQVPVKKALDYINLNQAINGVWFSLDLFPLDLILDIINNTTSII